MIADLMTSLPLSGRSYDKGREIVPAFLNLISLHLLSEDDMVVLV